MGLDKLLHVKVIRTRNRRKFGDVTSMDGDRVILKTRGEKLLEDVQLEVGKLMLHQLGYKRDFIFTFELR